MLNSIHSYHTAISRQHLRTRRRIRLRHSTDDMSTYRTLKVRRQQENVTHGQPLRLLHNMVRIIRNMTRQLAAEQNRVVLQGAVGPALVGAEHAGVLQRQRGLLGDVDPAPVRRPRHLQVRAAQHLQALRQDPPEPRDSRPVEDDAAAAVAAAGPVGAVLGVEERLVLVVRVRHHELERPWLAGDLEVIRGREQEAPEVQTHPREQFLFFVRVWILVWGMGKGSGVGRGGNR